MRLIDAEQYRKEFLDSRDFEPMKILDFQPTIQAIPISDNATNGDMIKAMFPDIKIHEHEKTDICDAYIQIDIWDFSIYVSMDWWNAPYKGE